ncbi:MAG: pyruvate kinase [Anaerosporomusa subterranea]|jgi:pyruvate kinase|nr:pyruvate kinase [Anaerosporomusa subterranea]
MEEVQGRSGSEKSYRAIAEYLRQAIENDHYRCGDRLPSEKELSALFNVSRSSVREALTALEYVGLIEVRGGSGYYVAGNKTVALDEFIKQCHAKVILCAEAGWGIKTLKSLLLRGMDGVSLPFEEMESSGWSRQIRAVWQAAHDAAALAPILAEVSIADPALVERMQLIAAAKIDGVVIAGVRSLDDVLAVRQTLDTEGSQMQVFALCNDAARESVETIIRVSDGVILDAEAWEHAQTTLPEVISRCCLSGKQVYLAIRLEETAQYGSSPGSDAISRAVLLGCDGVYVRTGGAAQKYPVDALNMLRDAASTAQEKLIGRSELRGGRMLASPVANALCASAAQAAAAMKAVAFVVPTETGLTPRLLAKYHQGPPILAVTQNPQVARRLRLVWGVQPLLSRRTMRQESVMQLSVDTCLQAGYLHDGDSVVGVIGNMDVQDSRHSIQLITVGDVILKGQGVGEGIVSGRVTLIRSSLDLTKHVTNKILVVSGTDAEHVPLLQEAAGVIVEEGGFSSHAAISCLSLGKPAIIGASEATQLLLEDEQITMDIMRGLIFRGWVNLG